MEECMVFDAKCEMEKMKQNIETLGKCKTPHDFSIDLTPEKTLNKKWKCSRCGGEVQALSKLYYELGYNDGVNSISRRKHESE